MLSNLLLTYTYTYINLLKYVVEYVYENGGKSIMECWEKNNNCRRTQNGHGHGEGPYGAFLDLAV